MCTLSGNFLVFEVIFDAVVWDSFEAGGLYKRSVGGSILLYHWLLLVCQQGGLVRRCRESDYCNCCMDEAYEEG